MHFEIGQNIKKIELGPLLGVFISENKITKLLNNGWDSIYWRFQNWALENNALVYFFSLKNINWEDKTVIGYYFDSDYIWRQKLFPLPKVIYDRCFGKAGRSASYKLRKLSLQNITRLKVYNEAVKIKKKETLVHS